MYRRVLAFDYDGTLAENGRVPSPLQQALEKVQQSGYALFLVTGRRFEDIDLGYLGELFTGIVWENGAVLQHGATQELYLPFGYVDPRLVEALTEAQIPLDHGLAIVATWAPHEAIVWHVLNKTKSDAVIVHNKGALMILPPGTSKGTGLVRLLELCGYSARNLVSFGDGENDLSLFQISETTIAVADAVSSLGEVADVVMSQAGPAGVLEALERYWLDGRQLNVPSKQERTILIGTDEAGSPQSLSGAMLVSSNLGIFGDSGSGKSWVAGLLAEGMHMIGYQVLVIDPEGDFRGLRSLPGIIALSGNEIDLPSPNVVAILLEEASISVVLDLCLYPVDQRETYIADLLHALRPLKEHKFRPQWILLEEAQQFLPPHGNAITAALSSMLPRKGWAFVSYRPDRMDETLLQTLDHFIVTRLSDPEVEAAVGQIKPLPNTKSMAHTPQGYIWLWGQQQIRLRPAARRVPHIRHLYKYLDTPLPNHKRFYFRTAQKYLGLEAASLFEFKEILPQLPLESLTYHHARGDFVAWAKGSLDDEILASHLGKLWHRKELEGDSLRKALLKRVTERYKELHALR